MSMTQDPVQSDWATGIKVCSVCTRQYPVRMYDSPTERHTGLTCWCCTREGGEALRSMAGASEQQ